MWKYKNVSLNYVDYGAPGAKVVVLLHGWGQNIAMMKPVGDALQQDFRVVIIDFPGFGESSEPESAWNLEDYCRMLDAFFKDQKIKNPVLIGHSFGGRVAMMYAANYDNKPSKLVLCGSPYKQGQQKETLKLKVLRTAKKIPGIKNLENVVKRHVGSRDYRNATPVMRNTLVNILKEDLSVCAQKIACPTILLWGTYDEEAYLEEGQELEALIPDAALIPYEGLSHYAYLEDLGKTNRIVKSFLETEKE